MALPDAFLNDAVNGGVANVSHIALLNASGTELSGGSYVRKAVSWGTASSGAVHPTADLVFDVPAGVTVGGWAGYNASTAGVSRGGANLSNEPYTNAGTYTLTAASTGYDLN